MKLVYAISDEGGVFALFETSRSTVIYCQEMWKERYEELNAPFDTLERTTANLPIRIQHVLLEH